MYKYSGCFAMWSLFIDSILYMLNPPPPPAAFRGARERWGGFGFVVRWGGKNGKSPRENGAFGIRGRVLSVKEPMSDRVWAPPPAVLVVLWFCVSSLPGNTSVRFSGHRIFFEKIRDKGAGIMALIKCGAKRTRLPWENLGGRGGL